MAVLMKRCDQNNSFCVAPLPKYTEFGSLKQAAQLSPKAALPALCVVYRFLSAHSIMNRTPKPVSIKICHIWRQYMIYLLIGR